MHGNSCPQRLTGDLRLVLDRSGHWAMLPTDHFCVRKASAIFFDRHYWIYADVISWTNPYWPNTYNTDIHAFSSPDGLCWTYQGQVLEPGEPGTWDGGGVATPGAVVFRGRIHLFYSGRQRQDGSGSRELGLAVSSQPTGPFSKQADPIIGAATEHLDDPCPVLSADGQRIDLYYRIANHQVEPPDYRILIGESDDHARSWQTIGQALRCDQTVRAYETADVKRLGGHVIMTCFEHGFEGPPKTALFTSLDGRCFTPATDRYVDNVIARKLTAPCCAFQLCFITDENENLRMLGITLPVDSQGHYNLHIAPAQITRGNQT